MKKRGKGVKGQVTIFIILAIILIASVVAYFVFRDSFGQEVVPESISPVQTSFLSCIEQATLTGISILESSGGYIENPEYVEGSNYMPFSSELDFVGIDIPYWYYVSGGNIALEQVPTKEMLESQLEGYIENRVMNCNFDSYLDEGFSINSGVPVAEVSIGDSSVEVDLEMDLEVGRGVDVFYKKDHNVQVKSALGELYDSALEVYSHEKESYFLENYSLDVLRLYAPVDGVELTCSPKIWNAQEVFDDIREALVANIYSLKNIGRGDDYFVVEDLPKNVDVKFSTSENWPMTMEVNPTENNFLIAEPIGNQEGLGVLGFCYVPYHFVYSLRYPVLVQVYKDDEFFQFPYAVILEGNSINRREVAQSEDVSELDICENKNSENEIVVYDSNLNLVDADIYYECFGSSCLIGETEDGKLKELFPQCVNGYVVVNSKGFKDEKIIYSTVNEGNLVVILDKEYEKEFEISLDGEKYNGEVIVSFVGESSSATLVYPENNKINLSEGKYNVSVMIYDESEIKFGETVQEQCVNVPRSGVGGFFGFDKKECFEVVIPEQVVSNVLIGGGNSEYYFLDDELTSFDIFSLEVNGFGVPNSLEELQQNYILYEVSELEVSLR